MELYFLYSGTDMILPVAFLTDRKTCAEEIENAKIFIYYKLQMEENYCGEISQIFYEGLEHFHVVSCSSFCEDNFRLIWLLAFIKRLYTGAVTYEVFLTSIFDTPGKSDKMYLPNYYLPWQATEEMEKHWEKLAYLLGQSSCSQNFFKMAKSGFFLKKENICKIGYWKLLFATIYVL